MPFAPPPPCFLPANFSAVPIPRPLGRSSGSFTASDEEPVCSEPAPPPPLQPTSAPITTIDAPSQRREMVMSSLQFEHELRAPIRKGRTHLHYGRNRPLSAVMVDGSIHDVQK